jgi:hypothetical protein
MTLPQRQASFDGRPEDVGTGRAQLTKLCLAVILNRPRARLRPGPAQYAVEVGDMRVLVLLLMIPSLAACSSMSMFLPPGLVGTETAVVPATPPDPEYRRQGGQLTAPGTVARQEQCIAAGFTDTNAFHSCVGAEYSPAETTRSVAAAAL